MSALDIITGVYSVASAIVTWFNDLKEKDETMERLEHTVSLVSAMATRFNNAAAVRKFDEPLTLCFKVLHGHLSKTKEHIERWEGRFVYKLFGMISPGKVTKSLQDDRRILLEDLQDIKTSNKVLKIVAEHTYDGLSIDNTGRGYVRIVNEEVKDFWYGHIGARAQFAVHARFLIALKEWRRNVPDSICTILILQLDAYKNGVISPSDLEDFADGGSLRRSIELFIKFVIRRFFSVTPRHYQYFTVRPQPSLYGFSTTYPNTEAVTGQGKSSEVHREAPGNRLLVPERPHGIKGHRHHTSDGNNLTIHYRGASPNAQAKEGGGRRPHYHRSAEELHEGTPEKGEKKKHTTLPWPDALKVKDPFLQHAASAAKLFKPRDMNPGESVGPSIVPVSLVTPVVSFSPAPVSMISPNTNAVLPGYASWSLPLLVWVDDKRAINLQQLIHAHNVGITVVLITSTAMAKAWFEDNEAYVRRHDKQSRIRVITDNVRHEASNRQGAPTLNIAAGENILRYLRGRHYKMPVLVYTGDVGQTPYVMHYTDAGSTNDPAVVRQYLDDLAARKRDDKGWLGYRIVTSQATRDAKSQWDREAWEAARAK